MRPPIYSQNPSAEKNSFKKDTSSKKGMRKWNISSQSSKTLSTTDNLPPSTRNITISLTLAPPFPPFSAPTWGDFDGKPDGAQLAKRPGSCSRSSSSCHWDAGSRCRYRSMCHSPTTSTNASSSSLVPVVCLFAFFAIFFWGKQRSVDSKTGLPKSGSLLYSQEMMGRFLPARFTEHSAYLARGFLPSQDFSGKWRLIIGIRINNYSINSLYNICNSPIGDWYRGWGGPLQYIYSL